MLQQIAAIDEGHLAVAITSRGDWSAAAACSRAAGGVGWPARRRRRSRSISVRRTRGRRRARRRVPLDRVGADSESVGHLVFSSVVRVQGHPPAYRSEAKARWYLRQLEAPGSRRQLWDRLGASRRLLLVMLSSGSLAISDWATIPLKTTIGEVLVLPISPSHAVLAAPRSTPAAHLQHLLSASSLPDLSEAVYGVQICLWPRQGEDLLDPAQRVAAAERVRSNMLRWRQMLPLRASIHDELDE